MSLKIDTNISKELEDKLSENFNILDKIRLYDYQHNWKLFVERINKTRKPEFAHNDRYLIDHHDTDYYMPHCPYGLAMFNFTRTCLNEDIPMHTVIIVTNHIGLKKELKLLLPDHSGQPTIIDKCFTAFKNIRSGINLPKFDHHVHQITKHGISMMGLPRAHRHILFRQLKERHLLNKYAVSYRSDPYKEVGNSSNKNKLNDH